MNFFFTDSRKSTSVCKYHKVMEDFEMPELGEKDPKCDFLSENQMNSIHEQMVEALNYWIPRIKYIPTARIYIGGSKFPGPLRAENDSHFISKPLGYSVGEVAICKSLESLREAEHFAIKTVKEFCGEYKLLNLTGGGGGYQEEGDDIGIYYLYCLYYIDNQAAIEMSKIKKTNDLSIMVAPNTVDDYTLIDREVGFMLGAPLFGNIHCSTASTLKFADFFGYKLPNNNQIITK